MIRVKIVNEIAMPWKSFSCLLMNCLGAEDSGELRIIFSS